MQIKLSDGESFPRGLCRVSLLAPCPLCNQRFMDNYPERFPVWSDAESNLVCRECWATKTKA